MPTMEVIGRRGFGPCSITGHRPGEEQQGLGAVACMNTDRAARRHARELMGPWLLARRAAASLAVWASAPVGAAAAMPRRGLGVWPRRSPAAARERAREGEGEKNRKRESAGVRLPSSDRRGRRGLAGMLRRAPARGRVPLYALQGVKRRGMWRGRGLAHRGRCANGLRGELRVGRFGVDGRVRLLLLAWRRARGEGLGARGLGS